MRVAAFLPLRLWPPSLHVNLRNHRKILVVDGEVAFTGGMNIADYHCVEGGGRRRVIDLHLRLRGPVVSQIEAVFAEDWHFATGQALPEPATASRRLGQRRRAGSSPTARTRTWTGWPWCCWRRYRPRSGASPS